jgi:hypothetical protein
MPLEFLKVVVQPVVLERNEEGQVVKEQVGEPTPLYSIEQITEFMEKLRIELHNANEAMKKEKEVESNGS